MSSNFPPLLRIHDITVKPFPLSDTLSTLSRLTVARKGRTFLASLSQRDYFGRFSIYAADPVLTARYRDGNLLLTAADGAATVEKIGFADALHRLLAPMPGSERSATPFGGVAVGYLAYDACRYLENVTLPAARILPTPDLVFQFTDTFIIKDHFDQETYLLLLDTDRSVRSVAEREEAIAAEIAALPPVDLFHPFPDGPVTARAHVLKDQYLAAIRKILGYIRAGDVYQVNYAYPISIESDIDTASLFMQYVQKNPVDFAAYGNYDDIEFLSLSPECFFTLYENVVKSYPIKGTIGRSADPEQDIRLRKQLQSSEKDLAELSMIVDLIRNDIGKVALPGSVKVKQHASLETFHTLYHLYSVVQGTVDPDDRAGLLTALFPGGSITGTPKVRAMEIISELEPYRRGLYTGSIGWAGYGRDMAFNIAIRTIQKTGNLLYYCAGGGIVADSDPELEYEETLVKTRAFFNIFPEVKLVS
ncbi:MAG TPA: anthranilate synthase component I family protein [bacterium]|nr:anthranilate synthase component I family protein [bacterium]